MAAVCAVAADGGRTVYGMGAEEPTGYVPVMLSNGSLCMTADFLGGVPSDETRKRKYDITRGIFVVGKRFDGQGFHSPHGIQVEAFNFGRFALKVSVDGKRCGAQQRALLRQVDHAAGRTRIRLHRARAQHVQGTHHRAPRAGGRRVG